MQKLQIVTAPNKLLHEKSKKVKHFDKSLTDLALSMTEMMRANDGVGLSAIQVGKPIRLTVIEYLPQNMDEKCREELRAHHEIPLVYLINPTITKKSREIHIGDEGCLSLPNVQIPIKRSVECNVLAYDLEGKRLKIRARDFFARVLQHEIDHLDGILITDKQ